MSTPDPSGVSTLVVPGEARPAVGHTPQPTHAAAVPTNNVPTPGAATAGLRVPGAPTLPEWDPVSLSVLIQKLANEQYAMPPAPDSGTSTASPPVPAPAVPSGVPSQSPVAMTHDASREQLPTGAQQAPLHVPDSLPTASSSAPPVLPFSAVPNFDAVLAPVMRLPLTDFDPAAPQVPTLPQTPRAPETPVPSTGTVLPATSAPVTSLDTSALQTPGAQQRLTAPQPEKAPAQPTFSAHELVLPTYEPTGHGYRHATHGQFDPYAIKAEFPILHQQVNGRPLVWLDNAATTQKPRAVIDRLSQFYERENSNIHRAAHTLAARATDAYESARETVRKFLNAPSVKDLIFVRGTTEGINLVAQSWGRRNIGEGDEILVTHLEHHANIVPWQMLAAEKGAKLKVAPVDDRGQIILEEYEKLLTSKTKLVSLTQVSNALGTITPAKQMVELAHRHGAKVLVDGAQAVSHLRVDLQSLDPDFFVFSGHKIFAPTGIGVVYGRSDVLEAMPPWQGGGNMISDVTFEKTTFHPPPMRFEAGTGNIADAVGLGAALDWVMRVGLENIAAYEHELLEYATECLHEVPGLTLYGTAPDKAGVLSFTLDGQKTEQVGALLDREGIAVRSGHHCAQPILRRFGLEATVRASLAPYNTCEDADALVAALKRIQEGRR